MDRHDAALFSRNASTENLTQRQQKYCGPKRRHNRKASVITVGIFFVAYVTGCALVSNLGRTENSELSYTALETGAVRVKRGSVYGSYEGTGEEEGLLKNDPLVPGYNCTPRAISEFPGDFLTDDQKLHGGVVVHFLIAFYLFGALAIVCDDYFVASLEQISEKLGLQPDVAGATFMAAGSSAPELFTSVIGVFISKNDVGLSTIVGSAIFNILCIIAICGLFAGMVIHLTWWPLFRDTSYYALSVFALVIIIYDGYIYWYEGLIFIMMYLLYIVLMYFNRPLEAYFTTKVAEWRQKTVEPEKQPLMGSKPHLLESGSQQEAESSFGAGSGTESDEEEFESPLTFPDTWGKRLFWVLMLPMILLFWLTIPDCRRPGCWQHLFALTFTVAIAWIAVCSYVLVWMVTIIGDTLGIPDTVMGLTLLAAGTSVPDALSGLFVARDGFGDMAVSNAVGSNVFDILLCLGLPWLLKTTAVNYGSVVAINSSGLIYTSLMLLSTVVILFLVMLVVGWKLNKKIGVLFLVIYIIVTVFACLYELNIFGDFNPPPCSK